jgi:hypothetical protein
MTSQITVREGVTLTTKQRQILDAMNAGIDSGQWTMIATAPYITLRYMESDLVTPDYARNPFQSSVGTVPAQWPFDSYSRCVFVNLITGKPWSLLLGVSPCPWVGTRDGQKITMAKALEILADPASVF